MGSGLTITGQLTLTDPLALTVSGVAVGHNALTALTVAGTDNTAVGASAGTTLTTGYGNILIGSSAGATMTTGANNVVIGTDALNTTALNTNGNKNVIIGHDAARNNSTWTGSGCVIIGAGVSASGTIGDDQVVLGLPSASLYIQGGLNYRWGPTITASTVLSVPLAQLYLVNDAAGAITITPPPVQSRSHSRRCNHDHTPAGGVEKYWSGCYISASCEQCPHYYLESIG